MLFKNCHLFDVVVIVYRYGWSKPVQHFIQHHVFAMLDEMLEWFEQLQNL